MEESKTILVVDDDEFLRKTAKVILEMNGFTVHTANNGRIGVDKAWEVFPDLILMDMNMPVMDGYTATRTLRVEGYIRPIVAFTGNVGTTDMIKAINAGCIHVIEKPVENFDIFIETIRDLIKESEKQDAPVMAT